MKWYLLKIDILIDYDSIPVLALLIRRKKLSLIFTQLMEGPALNIPGFLVNELKNLCKKFIKLNKYYVEKFMKILADG